MFKALAALIDNLFKPVNAFFSKLTGASLPAQGGNVLEPGAEAGGRWVSGVAGWVWVKDNPVLTKLLDKLPDFVIDGAPTPLTALPLPTAQLVSSVGLAPISLFENEFRKEA